MSWFTKQSAIAESTTPGDHWKATHKPGTAVPHSGIYICTCCKVEVTSNKSDPFPPLDHPHKSGAKWRLNVRTNTEGK